MCEGGQQGVPLHHQQDPAGGPDQVQDRGPDVHRPPVTPQLLQAALPGHHAPHQARPQEGGEGAGQVRLRRQRPGRPAVQEGRNLDDSQQGRGELVDGSQLPGADWLHPCTLCCQGGSSAQ